MFDGVQYSIKGEIVAQGQLEVAELLDILEEGLEQCRCGKGYTTEEVRAKLKERLEKINNKHKKTLTNLAKSDIIPEDN